MKQQRHRKCGAFFVGLFLRCFLWSKISPEPEIWHPPIEPTKSSFPLPPFRAKNAPMFDRPFTIALDGPAAAGKGTIARAIAEHYQIPHLDTGVLYRAVGLKTLDGADPIAAAKNLTPEDLQNPERFRTGEVGEAASQVAAIPKVRAALLEFQKSFARQQGGAVLDGRDIGTVVCPEAEAKLFVTASPEIRAERRFAELVLKNPELTLNEVLEDLRLRDERDQSRTDAPMKQAPDALLLDTSKMSIETAVAEAIRFIEEKRSV